MTKPSAGPAPANNVDALGLKLDDTDILTVPPAIMLYGVTGAGKSREFGMAFPDCLYVQSSPRVLRPLAAWIKNHPEEAKEKGIRLPKRVTIPKTLPGSDRPLDPRPALTKIMNTYRKASRDGRNPYKGLIFDEWSELAFRAYEAISMDPKYGDNNFARIDAIKELHYTLAALPEETDTVLGLVCHEREPVFDVKKESPTKGRMTHRGGPKLPIKNLTQEIAAAMDVVLRIVIEDEAMGGEVERLYQTEVTSEWVQKFRGDGQKPREPLGLRDLLVRCGYNLGA